MTVNQCIQYIDGIEPNAYTAAQKAMWLSEVEGKVYTQLLLVQPYEFTPIVYDPQKDRDLALPAPYDRMYPRYLQAMIHYANGEYKRYANSMAAFNEVWSMACQWFGGDYDVSDRWRNRRVEVGVNLGAHADTTVFNIPQGCAFVGGRILVKDEGTYHNADYLCPAGLETGTYNIKRGKAWYHFTTEEDYPEGTKVHYYDDHPERVIINPPNPAPTALCALSAKKDPDGIDLEFTTKVRLAFNEEEIASFDPMARGATPMKMLIADRGGTDIIMKADARTDTNWNDDGTVVLTGHLLICDEEFFYSGVSKWQG